MVSILGPILESVGALTAVVAVFHDVKTQKIPNRLLLRCFLAALGIRVASVLVYPQVFTPDSFLRSLAAMPLLFFLLWLLFRLRGLGAGDCKLILCLSFLLPYQFIPYFIFLSFTFGALIGLMKHVIVRKQVDYGLENGISPSADHNPSKILFSVPVLLSYFTVVLLQTTGLIQQL